jgi:hypothetical protein
LADEEGEAVFGLVAAAEPPTLSGPPHALMAVTRINTGMSCRRLMVRCPL